MISFADNRQNIIITRNQTSVDVMKLDRDGGNVEGLGLHHVRLLLGLGYERGGIRTGGQES